MDIDCRGTRTAELRNNVYGHRPWKDTPCGMLDAYEGSWSSANPGKPLEKPNNGLEFQDWIKKWTNPDQRCGWRHKGDLKELPRYESVPIIGEPFPQEMKTKLYGREDDDPLEVEEGSAAPPIYPNPENWKKTNSGKPYLPTRQKGGNFTWLPSHTEILWQPKFADASRNFATGTQRNNPKVTEQARIQNQRKYHWQRRSKPHEAYPRHSLR